MDREEIIAQTRQHVESKLSADTTGHGWWHACRVTQTAKHLAHKEGANLFITELAALLHDIDDWKFNAGDLEAGPKAAGQFLKTLGMEESEINHICNIIRTISFKGAHVPDNLQSIEACVVQDADRLDAIGAIGIARTFAYSGFRGHPIYTPSEKPTLHGTFSEYQNNSSPSINHFYEKLLLLKDRMKTVTGRAMAQRRHTFMENFLAEFYKEWNGEF